MVKLLVRYKADVNAQSVERQTPLHVVAANNSLDSLLCLLPFIDDVDVADSAGRTALHHAAYNGHSQVCIWWRRGGGRENNCPFFDFGPWKNVFSCRKISVKKCKLPNFEAETPALGGGI